jgi:hypothetical protein
MNVHHGPAAGHWQPVHPRDVRLLLSTMPIPWWIAGGWALDLFLGRQSRPHKDVDIGILRRDTGRLLTAMSGWEFFEAQGGKLFGPLSGHVRKDVNSLWARRSQTMAWGLELLLDESEGDQWIFRRDRRIRRPLDTVIRYDAELTPYLAPEIQLLYKSKHPRPEDNQDFQRLTGHLDPSSRQWLCGALGQLNPAHPWLAALGGVA